MSDENAQIIDDDWITFPGRELERKRPGACGPRHERSRGARARGGGAQRALEKDQVCPACREQLRQAAASKIVEHRSGDCRFIAPFNESTNRQSKTDNRKLGGSALCFQCYRAELDRERARASEGPEPKALGVGPQRREISGAPRALETVRWQWLLPFEPVDKVRLERLKAERAAARATMLLGTGRYADKRHRAQIAARHALDAIAAGLNARQLAPTERDRVMSAAISAAELQFPESWLPFVVAR